jgi:hypothetical protein
MIKGMAVTAAVMLVLVPAGVLAQGKSSGKSQKSTAMQHGKVETAKGHGKPVGDELKKKHGVLQILKGHGKATNPSSHDSLKGSHGKYFNPSAHYTMKDPHGKYHNKSTHDTIKKPHGKYHNKSMHDTDKKR